MRFINDFDGRPTRLRRKNAIYSRRLRELLRRISLDAIDARRPFIFLRYKALDTGNAPRNVLYALFTPDSRQARFVLPA